MTTNKKPVNIFRIKLGNYPDLKWLLLWLTVLFLLWIWNLLFLNAPALRQIESGFSNTIIIALFSVVFTAIFSWATVLYYHFSGSTGGQILTFLLDLIRSIPQVIGVLFGYMILTFLVLQDILQNQVLKLGFIAMFIAFFLFGEVFDLLLERIRHFQRHGFFTAMRVCGISDHHIINREVLLRNSIGHIFNKLIAVFGMTIFLQCSVDFIVSVGLSTRVSAVNLPVTLGSLLAKIDSKQDILAIGHTLTDWSYARNIPFEHLQGITVAFALVFTLLCLHRIASAYSARKRLEG